MKIAILSDIHGNYLALEAVLNEATRAGVEYLFILGDVVGYYYHPDKVMELLGAWPAELIQGNHEQMLKNTITNAAVLKDYKEKYGSGLEFAFTKLNQETQQKLVNLSSHKIHEIDHLKLELCHGSPWDRDYYIYPDSKTEILDKCADTEADYVFMGHTHYPYIYQNKRKVIANAGSVGQSREKGSIASWIVLDTSNRVLVFKYTKYDALPVIEEVKITDPQLPYLYEVLLRN
jgi:putative phosphoesterase